MYQIYFLITWRKTHVLETCQDFSDWWLYIQHLYPVLALANRHYTNVLKLINYHHYAMVVALCMSGSLEKYLFAIQLCIHKKIIKNVFITYSKQVMYKTNISVVFIQNSFRRTEKHFWSFYFLYPLFTNF